MTPCPHPLGRVATGLVLAFLALTLSVAQAQTGSVASPLPLLASGTPLSGTHTIDGTTTNGLNQIATSCRPSSAAREKVYTFTVSSALTASFSITGYDTVLELRRGSVTGTVIACNDDDLAIFPGSSLRNLQLSPATYFLIVDGYNSRDYGNFRITATFTPGSCVPNCNGVPCGGSDGCNGVCSCAGQCSSAISLTGGAPTTGTFTVTGTTVGGTHSTAPACVPRSTAPEKIYRFEVQSTVTVTAEVSGYDTVLDLRRSDCLLASASVACNDDGIPGTFGSRISNVVLQPGTYYFVVDGYATSAGPYTLTVNFHSSTCTPSCPSPSSCTAGEVVPNGCGGTCTCTGTACGGAIALWGSGETAIGTKTVTGTTAGASHVSPPACVGWSGSPQRVYTFTTTQAVTLSLTSSGGIDTVVDVRKDTCVSASASVACNDDSPSGGYGSSLTGVSLSPGTYYILIGAYSTYQTGSYSLSVTLTSGSCTPSCTASNCGQSNGCGGTCPPCSSGTGTCSSPDPLLPSGATLIGTHTIHGTTVGYPQSAVPSCTSGSGAVDRIYSVTISSTVTMDATLIGNPAWDTVLDVRRSSCTGAVVACNDDLNPPARDSGFYNVNLTPGTYYFIVTAYGSSTAGAFTLTVTFRTGPPPASPSPSPAASTSPSNLPDLTVNAQRISSEYYIQEAATFTTASCAYQEQCVGGVGSRRLLRFTVEIPNVGSVPFVPPSRLSRPELYEYHGCHNHYHFLDFTYYELRDSSNQIARVGRKNSFCLEDVRRVNTNGPSNRVYTCSNQGISVGWADVYGNNLDCQWIDITGLSRGTYTLCVTVNYARVVPESNYDNNRVCVPVSI